MYCACVWRKRISTTTTNITTTTTIRPSVNSQKGKKNDPLIWNPKSRWRLRFESEDEQKTVEAPYDVGSRPMLRMERSELLPPPPPFREVRQIRVKVHVWVARICIIASPCFYVWVASMKRTRRRCDRDRRASIFLVREALMKRKPVHLSLSFRLYMCSWNQDVILELRWDMVSVGGV